MKRTLRLLPILLLGAACGDANPPSGPPPLQDLDAHLLVSPAAAGSGEPNLHSAGDRLYMSWQERRGGGAGRVRMAWYDGNEWSAARTIVAANDLFLNWADFPSIVELADGRLAAHWLRRGDARAAYDVRLALSQDDGATWSEPQSPHRDGTATEHGFVSLVPLPEGGMELFWLDGRPMADGETRMLLMGARLTGERIGEERVLDQDVCTCCQTSAVRDADGVHVVYRDHTADEVRDISAVTLPGGSPVSVHDDGWVIASCPVNGPAIAAAPGTRPVAWFTFAGGTAKVLLRDLAGRDPPTRLDAGNPLGRVDLAVDDDGDAWVTWFERAGEGRADLLLREVRRDGTLSPTYRLGSTASSRRSGFPSLAWFDGALHAAWTSVDPEGGAGIAVRRWKPPR